MRDTLLTIFGLNALVITGHISRGTADYFIQRLLEDHNENAAAS